MTSLPTAWKLSLPGSLTECGRCPLWKAWREFPTHRLALEWKAFRRFLALLFHGGRSSRIFGMTKTGYMLK
jgi:hypothetical protein